MSCLEIRTVEPTWRGVRRFVRFAETVYRDDPAWVAPLHLQQEAQIRKGPFRDLGRYRLLMAWRDGRPVARLSVHQHFAYDAYYGMRQGFFGFFEALPDAEAVGALLAAGERWLREQGCTSVLGPCSFTIYDQVGMLVEPFHEPPVVLCPYNPPYYPGLLEANGYAKEVDWYAYRVTRHTEMPAVWRRIASRVLNRPGVTLRNPELEQWDRELSLVRAIFNDAWADNWGHVPISDVEWRELAEGLRLVALPELCWILSVDGEPVAFSVTLPDLNEALRPLRGRLLPLGWLRLLVAKRRIRNLRTIAMGVLKPYRGRGFEVAMVTETMRRGVEMGYETCDCSMVVESNRLMLDALESLGGQRYKTFRVYRKALTGEGSAPGAVARGTP